MDAFTLNDLKGLMKVGGPPCVSIYMPTHVAWEQGQQDPVRLKNLLQQAENELAENWLRAPLARDMLQPARRLMEDTGFWETRSHGLALFLASELLRAFRLPCEFDELALVHSRFHIKPLLPLATAEKRFFVLALSQNKVRLYEADEHHIEPVEAPELPESMKEALNYTSPGALTQVHSAMKGSLGKQAAVFHGQGGQCDTRKEELSQFFRLVDEALRPMLRNEQAPLLLSGVNYLLPIYRQVNSYHHLAEAELTGNSDYLTPHQLHQKAWPLMAPVFEKPRQDALARYRKSIGAGRTSADINHILPAAHQGRVDVLFVDPQASQWGRFDPQTEAVELHAERQPDDEDLIDLAAVQTLQNRGTVYAVDRCQAPEGRAAALLRY